MAGQNVRKMGGMVCQSWSCSNHNNNHSGIDILLFSTRPEILPYQSGSAADGDTGDKQLTLKRKNRGMGFHFVLLYLPLSILHRSGFDKGSSGLEMSALFSPDRCCQICSDFPAFSLLVSDSSIHSNLLLS